MIEPLHLRRSGPAADRVGPPGSTSYTYDANGSLTAKGTQTIKYDPEQQPVRIQDGTSATTTGRPTTATASAGSETTATAPSTTSAATSASWPIRLQLLRQ